MGEFSELENLLERFYAERDWRQFQTPKDCAASLAIEAAELQQLFLWLGPDEQEDVLRRRQYEIAHELADVLINCLNLAHLAGVDLDQAVREKLIELAARYPATEVHGKVVAHE
jgi:NTP pyrophosphatase (non-canonical NTP hydrolase)